MEVTESFSRDCLLFFFFVYLDDRFAVEASIRALKNRPKLAKDNSFPVQFVRSTSRALFELKSQQSRAFPKIHFEKDWDIPSNISLEAWRKFHSTASSEEIVAMVYRLILGISAEDVAAGLDLSISTLQFRLTSGFHKLNGAVQAEQVKSSEL
jgi:DNA-directed RNA polymerase specialized sigma24 family protein